MAKQVKESAEDVGSKEPKKAKTLLFKVAFIREGAIMPEKSYPGDACWDIFCPMPVTLDNGVTLKVPVGLSFEFPSDYALRVEGKSGLAQLGITTIGNVVDSGYRGEVCITLVNLSNRAIHFRAGEKIAQFMFIKIGGESLSQVEFEELSVTERGGGGFGSTGLKPKEKAKEDDITDD